MSLQRIVCEHCSENIWIEGPTFGEKGDTRLTLSLEAWHGNQSKQRRQGSFAAGRPDPFSARAAL
jgi:hypothetical protein